MKKTLLALAALSLVVPVVAATNLWNVAALKETPRTFPVEIACSNEYGRVEGVEPIWIEGEPCEGRPTRIFAWWGLPKGASAEHPVPGMVLVHGGGGTAFAKWVKLWNDRGYAAIAMDTCGRIPQGEGDGKPHPDHPWSGPNGGGACLRQIDAPLTDQWPYHAVAAVMRSHSFLRSRSEVVSSSIGLTGISWGGYLTSLVMTQDDRFAFAAPVYGCGWYDLGPVWGAGLAPDRFKRWLDQWDPKHYLSGVRCPVLWCSGTNDKFYPMNALDLSSSTVARHRPLALSIKLRMLHGHPPYGDPKEITAFADSFLRGTPPLVAFTSAEMKGNQLVVSYETYGRRVVRAELLMTKETNPLLEARLWTAREIEGWDETPGAFSVPIPEGAVMYYVNLITDDGLVSSSRIFPSCAIDD